MIRRTRPSNATISHKRPAGRPLAAVGGGTLVLLAALVMALAPIASGAPRAAKAVPPAAPTKIAVKSATFKSVTVSWPASQSRTKLLRYYVYKNGTRLASTFALSYTVGGLLCGKSYTLGVASVTLAGVRSPIVSVIASTSPCPDASAPSAPTAVTQITATATSATVSWAKSTDNAGVAGYSVFRSGVPVGMTAGASYTFTGLLCGASYPAAVDAFDAAGNHSGQAAYVISASPCAAVPDTQPPSVPLGQRITAAGQTTVEMAWNASTDNVRVAGYELWLDNAKVGTTTGTTYTYTGLGCGTTHTVGLVAYDAAGNRSDRAAASGPASTSACPAPAPAPAPSPPAPASPPPSSPPPPPSDLQAPSTPSAAAVSASTTTSITLSWHASTDNVAVAGYGVYRGSQIGSTEVTSYTVTGLSCGASYTLGVDAYDAAGNRSAKAVVSAATSACPDTQSPTQPANVAQTNRTETSLSIRWDASSDSSGVAGYALFKAGAQVANVTGTTYTFTGLVCNTSYTLGVDAYDAAANHSTRTSVMMTTSPCMDTQAPSVPQNQQITGTTQTTIAMGWSAATDNVGVTGYEVWLDGAKVATLTGTTYTFAGLTCGTSHTFGVAAVDAAGNRSTQASVSRTTSVCSPPPTGAALVGSSAVEPNSDYTPEGEAEALKFTATADGPANELRLYVPSENLASQIVVGLYSDANDHPVSLLGRCTIGNPAEGAWNNCGIGTVNVRQGTAYWIAVLGPEGSGTAWFRSRCCGSGTGVARGSSSTTLTDLPSNWTSGTWSRMDAPVSAYATTSGSPSPTPPPTPPPAPTPPPSSPTSPVGSANLWIDTNGGSCSRQATAAAYNDGQACASFAAAYAAATSGDTVGVRAGSYGSQFFADGYLGSQAGGTKSITFRGEPGNVIRQLHFGSPNLTFDGLNLDAGGAMLGSTDGAVLENGGEPFVFRNGSVGNVVDQKGAMIDGRGIVIENTRFHDVVIRTDGVHSECIFASVPEGMIVRNSTFTNCAVMDIFFVYPDWWSPLPSVYGNVVLEGNTFGHPDGTFALYIAKIGTSIPSSAPVNGWKIRNNVLQGPVQIDAPIGTGNVFCGNTGTGAPAGWGGAC